MFESVYEIPRVPANTYNLTIIHHHVSVRSVLILNDRKANTHVSK